LVNPRRGWGRDITSYEHLTERNGVIGKDQHGGRKLPERVYLPPPH